MKAAARAARADMSLKIEEVVAAAGRIRNLPPLIAARAGRAKGRAAPATSATTLHAIEARRMGADNAASCGSPEWASIAGVAAAARAAPTVAAAVEDAGMSAS